MFLNCHSYHSLRYGTIPIEDLVHMAKELGIQTLVLTDINTSAGVFDFTKECLKNEIKPIVGIEFRREHKLLYIALAKNPEGFAEMCKYLSDHNLNKQNVPDQAPDFCNSFVVYPLSNTPTELHEHEYIGIRSHELTKLVQKTWQQKVSKMVVLHPVTYRTKKEFNLHKIMRAIDLNVILSRLTPEDYCSADEQIKAPGLLHKVFEDFPSIIENTNMLIEACSFDFNFKGLKNKKYYTGSRDGDKQLLTVLANNGLVVRYGNTNKKAKARIEKELKVIDDLGFSSYFLITWDIIRYSNSQGFLHIGRGSGANSIVSYCLGITDICPIELDLYFERFLNPSRSSPPDFDIDWSWKDRDPILE